MAMGFAGNLESRIRVVIPLSLSSKLQSEI